MKDTDVLTIDCHYVKPGWAAAYLLQEGDEAAFIETNTNSAIPHLLAALSDQGLSPEQVKYIILTHIHLDHAGGASELMRLCPNAMLLVHPRGARHMIDPSKLVASAKKVYGVEAFLKLYGEIQAIDSSRVRAMEDEEELRWGARSLKFLHTLGHAKHHFCVWDSKTRSVFTGDSFGVIYEQWQRHGVVAIPSTSPTDFDPDQAIASIDRIVELKPATIFPTHFGPFKKIKEGAQQIKEHLVWARELLDQATKSHLSGEELAQWCEKKWEDRMQAWLKAHAIAFDASDWELIRFDLKLNGAGVAYTAELAAESSRLQK